ncbi:hypothetical protein L2E82_46138 [Cichorium intybus]|uniref:Uncharacterized protein n=1 Tax=Cichorium intybus TaxID=13427 RepID=A0ACB8YS11_CICIN|nr:hypothetical protein L2E82_46138 [Cichorium intybus]
MIRKRINLLVLVLLLLYVGQAEGYKGNRTRLITSVVPWVRRVSNQVTGCRDRPWVCNRGEEPSPVRRRCCGNRCVEVTSDVNNCGVCGIRCPFTWQCCRGVCVDTNINPFNCGRCFNRCPFFTFCTYGMCGYAGPKPPFPFPPKPPIPFPPKPPKPPIPFPPKPPKPPKPFPPKPPKPPKGPETPEPPQGQLLPELGQPPLIEPPEFGEPPLYDGQPPMFT